MNFGKDRFYPAFNGKIAYVRVNFGDGAYRKGKEYTHDDGIFGFEDGEKEFKDKEDDIIDMDDTIPSEFNDPEPVFT